MTAASVTVRFILEVEPLLGGGVALEVDWVADWGVKE